MGTPLLIFADNDVPDHRGRRAGQEAAEMLKQRMEAKGTKVTVVLPSKAGTDFADVWIERMTKGQKLAA